MLHSLNFRRFLALTVLGLLLVSTFAGPLIFQKVTGEGSWWNFDWPFRKMITVDHTKVIADLTNFPTLIDVTDADLANKAQANGNDIVFTTYLAVKLDHEIELYDQSTGHLIAWVAANLSASSDTILYMYYGNPTASNQQNPTGVWDSDYKMIQHLGQASGNLYDSTTNGNNGLPLNGVTQGAAGKIDGAVSFDGVNDVVNFTNIPSLGITDKITFEAWIKPNTLPGSNYWSLFIKGNDPYVPYQFYLAASTGYLNYYWSTNNIVSSGVAVTANVWQLIAISVDSSSSTAKFYMNGNLIATKTGVLGSDNGGLAQLGGFGAADYFNGMIDEVRISHSARSDSWISTEYSNQNSPSTFVTFGGEESSSGAPVISSPSPVDDATSVPVTLSQLSFGISDFQGDLMNYSVTTSPNIGSKSEINVGNGVYGLSVSGLSFSTSYAWSVNVTDGTSWSNETFHFTTNGPFTINLESPADGVITMDDLPSFRFTATHPSQSTFSASLWLDGGTPAIYGSKIVSSGVSSTITLVSPLPNGNYWWWINCTDGVGVSVSDKRRITINLFRGDKTFTASYDGSTRYYWLDLPDNFDDSTPTPLVFYLHGFGQNRLGFSQEFPELLQIFQNHTWIVATVDCRTEPSGYDWYSAPTRQDITDVLTILERDYNIDRNHIHIFGRSMGGGGALKYAMFNNQVIASVVDVHGVTNWTRFWIDTTYAQYRSSVEQAYGGTPSQVPEVYANESAVGNEYRFRHTPVMIIQGTADDQIDYINQSRPLNASLSALGYTVEYIEVPGAPHNPPIIVYQHEWDIFNWFNDHPLNLGNPKVTLNSPADNYWSITYPTSVTFSSTAVSDSESQLVNMSLYLTDSNNQSFGLYQTTSVSGTTATVTWTVLLGQGTYTWNVLAYDNVSLSGWGTNRTLTLEPDTTPPTFDPLPTNQTIHLGDPFIYDVNATDNMAISLYFIDDNVNFTINPSTGLIQNNTALIAGLYRLAIGVSDTSFNVNSTVILVRVMAPGEWLDQNWAYRKEIVIDHSKVAGNLTNFPVLIDVTDADIAAKAQSNGNDIFFTDYYGVKLSHEIEKYDSVTGHLVVWVNVPALSSTVDTHLYVYYGNPTATNQQNTTGVWNSDYKMVQHLGETSGTHYDSTTYGCNGTPSGGVSQGVVGKIDGADSFDGANDVVNFTSAPSLAITDKITFEAWIKPNSLPGGNYWSLFIKGNEPYVPYQFYLAASTGYLNYYWSTINIVSSSVAVTASVWQHIAISVDSSSSTAKFYINGNLVATATGVLGPDNGGYALLGGFGTANYFNGMIDEVRISRTARSGAWITTEYNNQNNASSLYTIGDEQSSSGAPAISTPNPADNAIDVPVALSKLSFKLTDFQGDLMNYSVTTSPNIGSGSGINVANGIYNVSVSGLSSLTTYTWTVTATDGKNAASRTFTFRAEMSSIFDPYMGGWLYRRSITIDHTKVASNLTNFPVLIDYTDASLASHAQTSGNDIMFMNASGAAQKLNHQIEYYSNSQGHLVAWVNIPLLSSTTDTIIYMYYGNPTAPNQQNSTWVWDSDFKMVQHLSETSGMHYDSTSNGNNGTPYGGVAQGVAGKIDGADQFSGTTNQYVQGNSFTLPDTYALSMWFKANTVSVWQTLFEMGTSGSRIMCWLNGNQFGALGHRESGYTATTNANLVTGQWYYAVFTFNYSASSQARLFINGAEFTLSNNNGIGHAPSTSGNFRIGYPASAQNYPFNGIIDEVRLSKTARTPSWTMTEYNNQNSPSTFYAIGAEETAKKPTLSMTKTDQTCRMYGETFTTLLNVSDALGITGFKFEIHYNATLLDVVGIKWDVWTTGSYTTDDINGILQGYSSGDSINGNLTLLTVTFNATYHHIWKDETTVSGWKNIQIGMIYIQWANLSYPSSPDLAYVRGGLNQINVGPDFAYTFSPIQGDIDNNGNVDVFDLRTVAAFYDSANPEYNLTGDNTIDIFDLVVVGANFGYTYSP